jgi:hypothetical protein
MVIHTIDDDPGYEMYAYLFRSMFGELPDISKNTPGLERYRAMTIEDLLRGLTDDDLRENARCKCVLIERMEAAGANNIVDFTYNDYKRRFPSHEELMDQLLHDLGAHDPDEPVDQSGIRRMFEEIPDISANTPGLERYRAMTNEDLIKGLVDDDLCENTRSKRVLMERMEVAGVNNIVDFFDDYLRRKFQAQA